MREVSVNLTEQEYKTIEDLSLDLGLSIPATVRYSLLRHDLGNKLLPAFKLLQIFLEAGYVLKYDCGCRLLSPEGDTVEFGVSLMDMCFSLINSGKIPAKDELNECTKSYFD